MWLCEEHFSSMCETPGLIPRTIELAKKKLNLQTSTLAGRLTQVGAGLGWNRRQVGLGCQSTWLYQD